MSSDALAQLLRFADTSDQQLRSGDIARLARVLSDVAPEEFIDATARVCALSWDDDEGPVRPGDWLQAPPCWWIEAGTAGNTQGLLAAVVAAIIVSAGLSALGLYWLAHWLPTVLDIDAASVAMCDGLPVIRVVRRDGTLPTGTELAGPHDAAQLAELTRALAAAAGPVHRTRVGVALTIDVIARGMDHDG